MTDSTIEIVEDKPVDKPRSSILVPVVVHVCHGEEEVDGNHHATTPRNMEAIPRKSVKFKRKKSLFQMIEPVIPQNRYIGVPLTVLASLQYSICSAILKKLEIHPMNLLAWRFATASIIIVPLLVYNYLFIQSANAIKTFVKLISCQVFGLSVIYGAVYCNAVILALYGLSLLNIGDFSAIIGTFPLFLPFATWLFLKTDCDCVPFCIAAVGFIGTAILGKPILSFAFSSNQPDLLKGTVYTFGAMMLLTICRVVNRHLKGKVNYLGLLFVGYISGLMQTTLFAFYTKVLRQPMYYLDMCLISASAALEISAQICLHVAIQHLQEGEIVGYRVTEIMFAFVWQILIFHVMPGANR